MSSVPEGSRRSKTLLIVLIIVGVLLGCIVTVAVVGAALFWPVRQEITGPEVPAGSGQESSMKPQGTPETIEDETESVAAAIMSSSSGWATHITGVETTRVLRRPVIVISTDIGPEQADLSDELASSLASFASGLKSEGGEHYTYFIKILSSDGDMIGAVSTTDERWQLDTPPAPDGPGTLKTWLETVYGAQASEPEAWVRRIIDISRDASDPNGYVVVSTDLDADSLADQQVAQTIIDAVNSSGATFAPGIRVLFSDGSFEWSSALDGTDPYAF